MSSIRLLVLGVIGFAQPVHGYDVRRELQGWGLEGWVNVQPGSIYSALKTLERDGFISTVSSQQASNRPERTEYVMTAEGDKEFQALLRAAWWQIERGQEPFFPAICFLTKMTREELIAAVQARITQQEAQMGELRFVRASIRDGATGEEGAIPEHVRENIDFATFRLKADIDWAKQFIKRLRAGAYRLRGDPE